MDGSPARRCAECGKSLEQSDLRCPSCDGLPEIAPPMDAIAAKREALAEAFARRRSHRLPPWGSGVWRFAELVSCDLGADAIVSMREGGTRLIGHAALDRFCGVAGLLCKHEGDNPTGSFKDRGMTVAVSRARVEGARVLACASTGNTSASLAAYAARAGLTALVVVPAGAVAVGKIAQALAYGAQLLEVEGSFDRGLSLLEGIAAREDAPLALLNSVNPWRIEGQKTLAFEVVQELGPSPCDWLVFPAGNLGNTSAFGKGLRELAQLGWLERCPRLVAVQADGAAPFSRLWAARKKGEGQDLIAEPDPQTIATAIKIGDPRSWRKALREIESSDGAVLSVSDEEIWDAKRAIDAAGIGCEPASAASLAGIRRLVADGTIKPQDRVVAVLTGNLLKDPDAAVRAAERAGVARQRIPAEESAILEVLDRLT